MCFDTKLGHGTCEICYNHCACTQLKYTLDKPYNPYVSPHKQPHYQPVKDCTYWPMLGSFKNCNTINSHKTTSSEDFEKFFSLSYTASVTTCTHWCKLENLVP